MKKSMYAETPIHIRAYEIDAMGIVSNIVYIKWFEDLRHLLLDKYFPYPNMMSEQKSPILMKTEVEYKKPLTIMNAPMGKAWFSHMGLTKWEITLEIWDGETLHCRGKQTGGFYDISRNRPVPFPKWFVDVYNEGLKGIDICHPSPSDYDEIVSVWESSVRATHTFVSEEDIAFYKPLVKNQALPASTLLCIKDENEQITAFMGVIDQHLDMLFVRPDQRGKGLGKLLVNHAMTKYNIATVDVNEQNEQAVGFYRHQGFEVERRSETDSMGKPFPILHMCAGKAEVE